MHCFLSGRFWIYVAIHVLFQGMVLAEQPPPAGFKLIFVSNRQHYWYPHIYLYEHDGKSTGKLVPAGEHKDKQLDHQPVLSADGKSVFFGCESEGDVGQIQALDLTTNKSRELREMFGTPNAVFSPSTSGNGKLLAISAWSRPGSSARWDVLVFDLEQRRALDLPDLNTTKYDERRAAISSDGLCLAFTTNDPEGVGLTDIRMCNLQTKQVVRIPELNSRSTDSFPSLTRDGRLVCFVSDREGGSGGTDIYLFDRVDRRFVELPGLNSAGHEQTPSISPDGRLIAFVSERFNSAGEHDIFVYDRLTQTLIDTPSLNTDRDEYDPCIISFPVR